MEVKVGDQLPNGAIVMEAKSNVILAKNNCGTRDEYVTWRWDGNDLNSTIWGHYFGSIADAAQDFEQRMERV